MRAGPSRTTTCRPAASSLSALTGRPRREPRPGLPERIGHPRRGDGLVDEALGVPEQDQILEGERAGLGVTQTVGPLGETGLDELEDPRLGGAEHRSGVRQRVGPRLDSGLLHDGTRGTSGV